MTPRPRRLSILIILFGAFALRVYALGAQELRGDEAFGYFFSLRSLGDIVMATIALNEPHPVASYFVEHVWLDWAGHSEFALRFISVWFGVLAVALLYRLARCLELSTAATLLAAAFLAISPYAVWHSQDARMYTVSLALTIASTWLAMEALQRRRFANWFAYVVVTWLALNTHYFSAFIILAQNLFVFSLALFRIRPSMPIKQWLLAQISIVALYLPWLLAVRDTIVGYRGNGETVTFVAMWLRSLSVFAVGETTPDLQRPFFALLAVVLLLTGIARLASGNAGEKRALWLLLLFLATPLLATWISALNRPIFDERYLIAAAPPFYILLAVGVIAPLRAWSRHKAVGEPEGGRGQVLCWGRRITAVVGAAIAIILIAGALFSIHRYYHDPAYSKTRGWRELASAMERLSTGLAIEQVRLAENYPDPTLWYYYQGPVEHVTLPFTAHDAEGARRTVTTLAEQDVRRVILPIQQASGWDADGIAPAALAEEFALVHEAAVASWPVQVYDRPVSKNMASVNAKFANGLTLQSVSIQPQALRPGGVLAVHLRWKGPGDALPDTGKIFLHLLDDSPAIVTQTDQPISNADLAAGVVSYGIALPLSLPAGQYRLIMGLYDPGQPGAPRILTIGGADYVTLEEFTIP